MGPVNVTNRTPSRGGSGPHLMHNAWTHMIQPSKNGISIGPAIFAQLTGVPNSYTDMLADRQTHRPRYVQRM